MYNTAAVVNCLAGDKWRAFVMCLFDRQMGLLDQLRQFMVKMHSSWFVIIDIIFIHIAGVIHIFVYIIIFYNQ